MNVTLQFLVIVNAVLNRRGRTLSPLARGWALGTLKYAKRIREMAHCGPRPWWTDRR